MNPISTFTKHTQADVMHINSTVLSCWQCVVHYMYTMGRGIGFVITFCSCYASCSCALRIGDKVCYPDVISPPSRCLSFPTSWTFLLQFSSYCCRPASSVSHLFLRCSSLLFQLFVFFSQQHQAVNGLWCKLAFLWQSFCTSLSKRLLELVLHLPLSISHQLTWSFQTCIFLWETLSQWLQRHLFEPAGQCAGDLLQLACSTLAQTPEK